MLAGLTRFTDLRDSVPGLSDRLLNERLRELDEIGVVHRCTATRDVHYYLTDVGKELEPVLASIGAWAEQLSAVTPIEAT